MSIKRNSTDFSRLCQPHMLSILLPLFKTCSSRELKARRTILRPSKHPIWLKYYFFSFSPFKFFEDEFKKLIHFRFKLHAITAGLKAMSFYNCLKHAQSNRLCCGGHGYSLASGLPQIIQEADAGCSYEGDNIVLLLQTARYLLKCVQSGVSPHFQFEKLHNSGNKPCWIRDRFSRYLAIFDTFYDQ